MIVRIGVTAAGTSTAFNIVRSIRRNWGEGAWITTLDASEAAMVAASFLADSHCRVPLHGDASYADSIRRVVAAHHLTHYYPVLDEEVEIAADLREGGAFPDTKVFAPSAATVKLCRDKLALHHRLRELGLPTPDTREYAASIARPGILKPRRGLGSRGFVEYSPGRRPAAAQPYIWQERLVGPEYTVDCFRSCRSELFAAQVRERLEVKAGVCTKARFVRADEVVALTEALATAVGLRGAFCIQLMHHAKDHGLRIVDVNPRPGGGTALSSAAGFDPVAATLAEDFGADPEKFLNPVPEGVVAVRSFDEWVTFPCPV